jgi:hypothetical protein
MFTKPTKNNIDVGLILALIDTIKYESDIFLQEQDSEHPTPKLPNGIVLLQLKVLAFEKMHPALYGNPQLLLTLLTVLSEALNAQVIKSDEGNKIAIEFYSMVRKLKIYNITTLKAIDTLTSEVKNSKTTIIVNEYLWMLHRDHDRFPIERGIFYRWMKEHRNIQQKIGAHEQDLLIIHQYLIHLFQQHHTKPINIDQHLVALKNLQAYVKNVLLKDQVSFMMSCSSVQHLASCLRSDSYFRNGDAVCYDAYENTDRDSMKCKSACANIISDITIRIMETALSERYFDRLFKNVDDISNFISALTKNADNRALKIVNNMPQLISLLTKKILESPKFLQIMLNNPVERKKLFAALPDFEKIMLHHIKVNYRKGLAYSMHQNNDSPIPKLPRDIIKLIAEKAFSATIEDDPTTKPEKKNKK